MLGGVLGNRTRTSVRVLNVVHGVLVRAGSQQVKIQLQGRVNGRADERVASSVDTNGINKVFEGDDCAGTLGHANGFTILHEVHHLTDENLHVLPFTSRVTEGLRHGVHAANVPVMVCTQHDDDMVGTALTLVQVVGNIASEVGGTTVRLDDNAVLVVPKLCRLNPGSTVLIVDMTALAEDLDRTIDGT